MAPRRNGLLAGATAIFVAISCFIQPASAVKIMIVGDSITHGTEGDYTWRYRLWQLLAGQGLDFEFVGPYMGTKTPATFSREGPPRFEGESAPPEPLQVTGYYALDIDPRMQMHHYSYWGRQVAQHMNTIYQEVAKFQPDILLVELGFNDLGWFVSGPEGTLQSMKTFVDNARRANPNIKFAIANVPQRTFIDGRKDLPVITAQYNGMLARAIPQWRNGQSPIVLVDFRHGYTCKSMQRVSYDGLHPNARGEYEIARVFGAALQKFGVGSRELIIPTNIPPRRCVIPANIRAQSSPAGITVTWDTAYGAFGYKYRSRNVGSGDWEEPWYSWPSNQLESGWVLEGQEIEYQVRSICGENYYSDWTAVVSARATPQNQGIAGPPADSVRIVPTDDGFTMSWAAPPGVAVERYGLLHFDTDTYHAFLNKFGVAGTSHTVRGLKRGNRYAVAVEAWTTGGVATLPSGARGVIPGGGRPGRPTNLRIVARDGVTVRINFDAVPGAAGYQLYTRNVNQAGSVLVADPFSRRSNCYGVTFLFPGAWNFEYCLMAYNGNLESDMSCIMGP
ncbi:fibronectin type III domain-containing protein, partial [Microdochium trichocladiopsis]